MKFSCMVRKACLYTMPFTTCVVGQEILISTSEGEFYSIHVEPEHTFNEVIETIQDILPNDQADHYLALFQISPRTEDRTSLITISKQALIRNYDSPPSDEQKSDIAYIVTTLAYTSLVKLKSQESSLKKAGDRIDAVHPLRFLETIFTNEELKVAMRNLEGRSWVWKDFLEGLTDSLKEEYKNNNILQFVDEFAANIKLDSSNFISNINNQKWKELVEQLIKIVPREGNIDKYNM